MKVAVLGAGSIGKRHLRNLRNEKVGELMCFDPSAERREEVKRLFSDVNCFGSVNDIFQKGCPNIVFVCSPPQYHLSQLEEAINNGCHTFVEKPFCMNEQIDKADEVLLKADSEQLKVMTGFNMRYVEPITVLKNWLDDGKIGSLMSCRISLSSYMPNWHPWEDYRGCFMAFWESGGGALFDCVHGIDMAQWFGGEISRLLSIQKTSLLEMETDDIAVLIGETESGAIVDLYFDFLDRSNRRRIELIGSSGTAIWTLDSQHTVSLHMAETTESTVVRSRFDWDSCYVDSIKSFFKSIEFDTPLETDGWNGLSTQRVLEMAVRSNRIGAMVSR